MGSSVFSFRREVVLDFDRFVLFSCFEIIPCSLAFLSGSHTEDLMYTANSMIL